MFATPLAGRSVSLLSRPSELTNAMDFSWACGYGWASRLWEADTGVRLPMIPLLQEGRSS